MTKNQIESEHLSSQTLSTYSFPSRSSALSPPPNRTRGPPPPAPLPSPAAPLLLIVMDLVLCAVAVGGWVLLIESRRWRIQQLRESSEVEDTLSRSLLVLFGYRNVYIADEGGRRDHRLEGRGRRSRSAGPAALIERDEETTHSMRALLIHPCGQTLTV